MTASGRRDRKGINMTANLKANVHATGQHKDVPAYQRLKPLLGEHSAPCLSLYQPTYRQFPDSQQNVVRYKNLLRELETALEAEAPRTPTPLRCCGLSQRLLDDADFWAHPQDGIAVFGAPGFFHVEKVQRRVPEMVVVNDHLHLKPLVRVFQSEDTYQILALDRAEIRMYQGDRYVLDEIVMAPSVPRTIEEALGPARHAAGHARARAASARGMGSTATGIATGAQFHGHGSKNDDEPQLDIERFFRVVDRAVTEAHSKPSTFPLILAALPEYHSRFHEISHNPYLLDEGIHTNADARSIDAAARGGVAGDGAALPRAAHAADRHVSRGESARAGDRRSHACARIRDRRARRHAARRSRPAHAGARRRQDAAASPTATSRAPATSSTISPSAC